MTKKQERTQKKQKIETKGLRTCIFSKKKFPPASLWRFTVQNGSIVFDNPQKKQKGTGRGAYMQKNEVLLEKLPKLAKKIAYVCKKKIKNPEIVFFK